MRDCHRKTLSEARAKKAKQKRNKEVLAILCSDLHLSDANHGCRHVLLADPGIPAGKFPARQPGSAWRDVRVPRYWIRRAEPGVCRDVPVRPEQERGAGLSTRLRSIMREGFLYHFCCALIQHVFAPIHFYAEVKDFFDAGSYGLLEYLQ